jgi:hypothetical protein
MSVRAHFALECRTTLTVGIFVPRVRTVLAIQRVTAEMLLAWQAITGSLPFVANPASARGLTNYAITSIACGCRCWRATCCFRYLATLASNPKESGTNGTDSHCKFCKYLFFDMDFVGGCKSSEPTAESPYRVWPCKHRLH